jgi:hypothetical protein
LLETPPPLLFSWSDIARLAELIPIRMHLQLLNQIAAMGQDLLVRGGRGGLTTLICLASCNSSDSECALSPASSKPLLTVLLHGLLSHSYDCIFREDARRTQECRMANRTGTQSGIFARL